MTTPRRDDVDAALDDTVAEVELEEALHAADDGEDEEVINPELLAGADPEAHYRNTARQRAKIRQQVLSRGGQFIIGLLIGILSIALVILAATIQSRELIIAAGVCAPPGLIFTAIRWRRWLDNAPYAYRLLTSLGEDAGDVLEAHSNKQMQRMRAKEAKTARKRK